MLVFLIELAPVANVMKYVYSSLILQQIQLIFLPSLIFASNDGAYLSEALACQILTVPQNIRLFSDAL
jgi:hypothetical protein